MLTKSELIELFQKLKIPFNEGLSSEANTNKFPRLVFWETMWDDIDASNTSTETIVTYQVSFHYLKPRDPKLLELRSLLKSKGVRPFYNHEFIEDTKEMHTFFGIDIIENLEQVVDEPYGKST